MKTLMMTLLSLMTWTTEPLGITTCEGDYVVNDMNGDGFVSIVGDIELFVESIFAGPEADDLCPPPGCTCRGDCNQDGVFTLVGDVGCFVDCVFLGACDPCGAVLINDMNDDGAVNVFDVELWDDCIYEGYCACPPPGCTCRGDCNGDGEFTEEGDGECFVDCVFNGDCL